MTWKEPQLMYMLASISQTIQYIKVLYSTTELTDKHFGTLHIQRIHRQQLLDI